MRRRQESNPPDGLRRRTRFEDEGGHQTPCTSAGDAIEAFAFDIREGAEHVTEGERRRIFELLRLRVVVGMDPIGGIQMSRTSRW